MSARPVQAPTKPATSHKSKLPPAAGASGGRAPLPATYFFPARYLHLASPELQTMLNKLRDPLCTHLYLLIRGHSVFETGEFLGSYAGLMELCTPPQPERGVRRSGPSMKVVRNAISTLILAGLMQRGETNATQGQLRLFITLLMPENFGTSMQ